MTAPRPEAIQAYYDERIEGKIRDFTDSNPRIEAAVRTIAEWAPPHPKRILEIGCGIGATSWRMARAWPDSQVMGIDISEASIAVARACFQLPNLGYAALPAAATLPEGPFDLVVLMDVYEHIPVAARPDLHASLRARLSGESRLVVSAPTPWLQQYDRRHRAAELQPVDEEIDLEDIARLASETETRLLFYREVGIWQYGDYFHLVLGRYDDLRARHESPARAGGWLQRWIASIAAGGTRRVEPDYLGPDALNPRTTATLERLAVPRPMRARLAAAWMSASEASR
jgi:2-polyprenyl-3-methyl-5-hydroxy-6-metoxy-1,4-benzoquinol methylase